MEVKRNDGTNDVEILADLSNESYVMALASINDGRCIMSATSPAIPGKIKFRFHFDVRESMDLFVSDIKKFS